MMNSIAENRGNDNFELSTKLSLAETIFPTERIL